MCLKSISSTSWVFLLLINLILIDCLPTIRLSVKEEQPVGTLIGSLSSNLPSLITNDRIDLLRFRLVVSSGDHSNYFKIDHLRGDVKLDRRLDREKACPPPPSPSSFSNYVDVASSQNVDCVLKFRVNLLKVNRQGGGLNEIVGLLRVLVNVIDIDDNPCQFLPSSSQTLKVRENTTARSYKLNSPFDPDVDPRHNIDHNSILLRQPDGSLENPNLFGLEIVNTSSPYVPFSLYLSIKRPLDYESRTRYQLLVVVTQSNRYRSTCSLAINVRVQDVNDNRPKFSTKEARIDVAEDISSAFPVYTPQASDNDTGPIYNSLLYDFHPLTSSSIRSTFRITPNNGSIFVKTPLDHSQSTSYKLDLIVHNPRSPDATDDKQASSFNDDLVDTMQLHVNVIDVNDNYPLITFYSINGSSQLTVTEGPLSSPVDFAVLSATDKDSGRAGLVSCWLDEAVSSHFSLTPIGDDGGVTKSDNSATFKGAMLKLSLLQAFDRESSELVYVTLTCSDQGQPRLITSATATVTVIDVNDNEPEFARSEWKLDIVEDSDPNRGANRFFIVSINATDRDAGDNGRIGYKLVGQRFKSNIGDQLFDVNDLISIDPDSGVIRSNGKLDYETFHSIAFKAIAYDHGTPSLSSSIDITINLADFNDETPQFRQPSYEFSVEENSPVDMLIGQVEARDADSGLNGALDFSFQSIDRGGSDPSSIVRLEAQYLPVDNKYQLKLFVQSRSAFDRELLLMVDGSEEAKPIRFHLTAQDKGLTRMSATTKIIIHLTDVNDEAPIFINHKQYFKVSSHEKPGFLITKFNAIDRDEGLNGTISYRILNAQVYARPEHASHKLVSNQKLTNQACPSHLMTLTRNRLTRRDLIGLFNLNASTGHLQLASAPNDLANDPSLTIKLDIQASDQGRDPKQTELPVCITFVDQPTSGDLAKGQYRHKARKGNLVKDESPNNNTYLYAIVGISTTVLVGSILFLVLTCLIWHRPRRKLATTNRTDGTLPFNSTSFDGYSPAMDVVDPTGMVNGLLSKDTGTAVVPSFFALPPPHGNDSNGWLSQDLDSQFLASSHLPQITVDSSSYYQNYQSSCSSMPRRTVDWSLLAPSPLPPFASKPVGDSSIANQHQQTGWHNNTLTNCYALPAGDQYRR